MDDRVGWCEYGEGEEMVAVLGHLEKIRWIAAGVFVLTGLVTLAAAGSLGL